MGPWFCMGNFNEVMWHEKNGGGNLKSEIDMACFRDALRECGLRDLGYVGSPYTWSNGRTDQECIQERLDRFTASEDWTNILQVTTSIICLGISLIISR